MGDAASERCDGGSGKAGILGWLQLCDIWKVRRAQFFLFVAIAALAFLGLKNAAADEPKRVLLVHSFGTASPPFTVESTAFETELVGKMGDRVDLDEVSLDMARYPDREMQEAIVDYLQKRRAKWQPDLVVPIGAPASIFVATYRDRLFPETPILYASADRRLLPPGALEKNAAYIGQVYEIPGMLEDMLQIAPATKNIAVVVGATPLEHVWQEVFQKATEPLAGRINFTYFSDLSFKQMQERVSTLPPDSYIFFLLLLRDAGGVTLNGDKALQQLHAVANAPINSIFEHQLGIGIVGGRLYHAERVGKDAAQIAIRILRGEPASSFPPTMIDRLPPQYDWRELQRWKINEHRLPAGSTILFREPTLWDRYRTWIIAGVSIFLLQGLLLAGLLANLVKRRRAERSLSESEKRFQTMADAAPVLMWMTGEDKLCTYVNKAWLKFTGQSLEHELGNGWSEGIYPDDVEKAVQTYGSAFDARQPFVMQYRVKRHDGEYRRVTDQGVPRYGPRGNFRGYVGACVDITDSLKKEAALRQFEERVALAAEAAQHGVWELDTVTNELWISDKARALLQLDGDAPTYEDFQARVHPDDRAARDAAIKKAIATKGDYEFEYRVLLRDGTIRWIGGRARCLADEKGELTRLLGVSVDVTKRKQAEEEAHRHREQINLLSRVSLLGEMTASLAHELNQPLSAIISNANAGRRFIETGKGDRDTVHEILTDVVSDARRAHDIIHNVRNTIKKGDFTRRRIDLNELVTNVVRVVRPDAVSCSCEVETSLTKDLPPIEGDPVQIQQVLVNLVSNAFDAMRQTPPDRRKVEISAAGNGDGEVRLSVRDHGTGIRSGSARALVRSVLYHQGTGAGNGIGNCALHRRSSRR